MNNIKISPEDIKKVVEIINNYKRTNEEIVKLIKEDIDKLHINDITEYEELNKTLLKMPKLSDYTYDIDKLTVDLITQNVLIKKKDIKKIIKLFL